MQIKNTSIIIGLSFKAATQCQHLLELNHCLGELGHLFVVGDYLLGSRLALQGLVLLLEPVNLVTVTFMKYAEIVLGILRIPLLLKIEIEA